MVRAPIARLSMTGLKRACRCAIGSERPSLAPYVTVTGPQGRRDRRRRAFMLPILGRNSHQWTPVHHSLDSGGGR